MFTDKNRLALFVGILALFGASVCFAGARTPAESDYTATAVTFINSMAKGDFSAAETNFTDQMKQAAPPDKLKGIWDGIILQAGAFQKTGATKIVHAGGYTTVIVDTKFKNKIIGFAVTFDSFGKIGGLHLVPAV
ncbi:MAG: DUF3887 domain-containing protein [Gammaproteobacteria bacterium]